MLNYRRILDWHRSHAVCSGSGSDSAAEELEIHLQNQYIEKKLESGQVRIWQDVQTKVRILVQASNLSEFSIDLFICFLDNIHKLIQVGREFSGSDSETLQESLQKQCLSYFQSYHTSRLDELKTHLENEGWALCPVKLTFNIRSLVEFSHLKVSKSPTKKSLDGESSYFKTFLDSTTPFDDALRDLSGEEDILADHDPDARSDSDDDLSEEQKIEIMNENEGSNSTFGSLKGRSWTPPPPKQGLCIANTTLTVLRLFGRYSHLMKLIHPIADQILVGMKQLFEYYFYSVNRIFSPALKEEAVFQSEELRSYLDRIRSEVVQEVLVVPETDEQGNQVLREVVRGIVKPPVVPVGLEEAGREGHYGLPERIVAVESCLYLAGQITELIPHLGHSLKDPEYLAEFFKEPVTLAREVRCPVYYACLLKVLSLDQILPLMGKVSWELREVRSQHSDYVDIMLKQFQVLCHIITFKYCLNII